MTFTPITANNLQWNLAPTPAAYNPYQMYQPSVGTPSINPTAFNGMGAPSAGSGSGASVPDPTGYGGAAGIGAGVAPVIDPATPDSGNGGNWFTNGGMGTLTDIAKILGGFGQIYTGIQANKLAKQSLAFQRQAYETNLANQIKTFNLSLEDRIRARYAQNERPSSEADAKIDRHKL